MDTEEQNEFKFTELSERAKQHAVERYGTPYDEWWEHVYTHHKEEGEKLGFEIEHIHFSGFWSQGDGASWSGAVNVSTWLTRKLAAAEGLDIVKYEALVALAEAGMFYRTMTIVCRGRYSHSGTMDATGVYVFDPIDATIKDGPLAGAQVQTLIDMYATLSHLDDLGAAMLQDAKDYADTIYKALEEEHEWLTSEERFADTAEANDWKFNEEGEMM